MKFKGGLFMEKLDIDEAMLALEASKITENVLEALQKESTVDLEVMFRGIGLAIALIIHEHIKSDPELPTTEEELVEELTDIIKNLLAVIGKN
jgi:hypothetical protein